MAEQDLDRNEPATPYKLEKARQRGQVAKSNDVASAVVFGVAVTLLYWRGWEGVSAQFRYDHALLKHAARMDATPTHLWNLVGTMVSDTLLLVAPLLVALFIAAVVGNVMQTGLMLSFDPLKADFSRMNPATGFKRFFTVKTLFDALRAILKLLVLGVVLYHALKTLAPQAFHLAMLPAATLTRILIHDIASAGLQVALAMALIALLDWGVARRQFAKQMRMSRREMSDEHKNREGDPRIKARIRELRRELLQRSQAAHRTREADVLITNPTHVAVALRYVHGDMKSPQVVAKGTGALAAVMRRLAAKHRIPVVQNRTLARALFASLEIEQFVPPKHYAAVARILVWVFAMREANGARHTGPAPTGATP